MGGRLNSSLLNYDNKHPFILLNESQLSRLIIADAHKRTLHGTAQTTLAFIRGSCWIIGGRNPVRSYISKCARCVRHRKLAAQQLMGQLPYIRVTPSTRPFVNTGIDYAGPFNIKTWSGRAARTYKSYLVLFICQATSAIHIEIVTDDTSEAFLAAYRRFTSRRGICKTLQSDCGTNLKGADSELKKLFFAASDQLGELASLIANDGTEWIFNPSAAPHFGGKWEAGLKSVKHHLRRVLNDTSVTYEQFFTLLTKIEGILNSRRWSKECLQQYYTTYKWNQKSPNIEVGNLVLILDERYSPSKWPLGRITHVHPGQDGQVRVVTIKTQNNVITRPITKLCPLLTPE